MPSKRLSNAASALRNLVAAIVFVIVGWLIARTWLACSAMIASGSMAPALVGPYLEATCPACRQTTRVAITEDSLQNLKAGRPVACGNCGTLIALPPEVSVHPGESILVQRNLKLAGPLQRWDLVACQGPESPEKIIVKRIVGLPGETVQIVDGDVFINGRIARKSLDRQASIAVPVYDAEHETITDASLSPRRWVPSPENRLMYHHQNRIGGKMVPSPITDQLAYNQWLPMRRDSFHEVSDLMLTFHASRTQEAAWLKVFLAKDDYEITFDYSKQSVSVKSPQPQTGKETTKPLLFAEAPCTLPRRPIPILISTVDRRLMIVVDRAVVIQKPLPQPITYGATPFSIESKGLDLDRLRIYRDVYYVRPTGIQARWGFEKPVRLGADEYFVLGDNSRISEDSRTWPRGPAIRHRMIFGRP